MLKKNVFKLLEDAPNIEQFIKNDKEIVMLHGI